MTDLIVRPSSLTTFSACQRRWSGRHMRQEIEAAGYTLRDGLMSHVGGAVGTGVHAANARSLEEKMRTGGASLGTDSDAEEVGIVAFRERVMAEGCDWDEVTPEPNTAETQIRRMSRAWRRSEASAGMPLAIEERLEATVRPGLVVSGQVDALMTGDPDQTVRDTKTGTSRRANGPQYGAYLLVWRANGHSPSAIVEDYLRRVPLKKEQPLPEAHDIDINVAQQEAWEIIEALGAAVDEFRRRAANPNGRAPNMAFRSNPADSLCSARWCPCHGTDYCKAHL